MSLETAQNLIDSNQFLVISKSWCPDCHYAKKVFKDLHTEPTYVELDKLKEGVELQASFLRITGQNTVPNVFIKGKHIGTEDDIARLLASGELKSLLKAANLINK